MQRESLTSAGPEYILSRQSQIMRLWRWIINHKILTAALLLIILVALTIIVLFFVSASPRRPITPTTQAAYGYISLLPKLGEAAIARPHDTTSPQRGGKTAVGFDSRAVNQKKVSASSSSYAATVQRGVDDLVKSVVSLGATLKQQPQIVTSSAEVVAEAIDVDNSTPHPAVGRVKTTPVSRPLHAPSPSHAANAKGNFTVPLQHGLSNIHAHASNALPLRK